MPCVTPRSVVKQCPAAISGGGVDVSTLNDKQRMVHDYVVEHLEDEQQTFLLLHGGPGTGKTLTCAAIDTTLSATQTVNGKPIKSTLFVDPPKECERADRGGERAGGLGLKCCTARSTASAGASAMRDALLNQGECALPLLPSLQLIGWYPCSGSTGQQS